jgi:hypothetical protein
VEFEELLAPVAGEFDIDEALQSWRWLVLDRVRSLVVTAFGDLFVVAGDGAVFFLDTAAGKYVRVAGSVSEWEREVQKPENLNEWFMPQLLSELWASGERLSQGECFDAVHSIALGGTFNVSNWKPIHWRVHFAAAGSLLEQIKDLPDGTKITGIKFPEL